MFIEVYEEVEVKLTALNYIMTSNRDSTCTDDPEKSISKVRCCILSNKSISHQIHSHTKCGEICHWRRVTDNVNCSGPWMDLDVPECVDYDSTEELINAYKE